MNFRDVIAGLQRSRSGPAESLLNRMGLVQRVEGDPVCTAGDVCVADVR